MTEEEITLVRLSSDISEGTTWIRPSVISGTWSAKKECLSINPPLNGRMAQRALTRTLLSDLHTWWFKDVPSVYDAPLPKAAMKRWFMQSSETDEKCWYAPPLLTWLMGRKEYGAAVEEASKMTVKEIDSIVESKEDAVAAVVLLDQLPRNMFRGMEAAKVFHLLPLENKKLMAGV
jgi:hypothetical protein